MSATQSEPRAESQICIDRRRECERLLTIAKLLEKIAKGSRDSLDGCEYVGMTTEFYEVLNEIVGLQH